MENPKVCWSELWGRAEGAPRTCPGLGESGGSSQGDAGGLQGVEEGGGVRIWLEGSIHL